MNFLEKIKSHTSKLNISDWKTLDSGLQLKTIVEDSFTKPIVLFKHSISCGLSAGAKYRLEEDWDQLNSDIDFYYLDLITYREVSNKIASQFEITHQSPQIIIISEGKAIYNTSHHRISISDLNEALSQSITV
jgi:bacillithiol system protein YtxJ